MNWNSSEVFYCDTVQIDSLLWVIDRNDNLTSSKSLHIYIEHIVRIKAEWEVWVVIM